MVRPVGGGSERDRELRRTAETCSAAFVRPSLCSPPRLVFFAAGTGETSSCVAFTAHRTTLLREGYGGVKNRGKSITERRGAPVATTETAWHCVPPPARLFRFYRSSLADRLSLSSSGCPCISVPSSLSRSPSASLCLSTHVFLPPSLSAQFPFRWFRLSRWLASRSFCFFLRLAGGVVLF